MTRPARDTALHCLQSSGSPLRGNRQRRLFNAQLSPGISVDDRSLFTDFWTNESKTTEKVLSRIPEGSDYKPDPKSRTAQEIAWQIVCEEKMLIDMLEKGKAEWTPAPTPPSMREVTDTYSQQSADIIRRLGSLPDDCWDGTLEFFGSQRPASPMAWSFSSTSCITAGRSRRTFDRWDQPYRRSTGQAATNPSRGRILPRAVD